MKASSYGCDQVKINKGEPLEENMGRRMLVFMRADQSVTGIMYSIYMLLNLTTVGGAVHNQGIFSVHMVDG